MSKNGGPINADRLKSFIDRIERLEEEQKAIGGDKRDVYSEAKAIGYDVKAMRKIVALRRQDAADRAEAEAILDTYLHALGMDTAATVVTVQPSEEELEERASRIVREVDRCMALVENGRLPRIVDIKELIGCSTGKAGKLRGLVAERISRSNAIHRENPENENPEHDAETGELVDDGGEPAADVPRGTAIDGAAQAFAAALGDDATVEFHAAPGSLFDKVGEALEKIAPGKVQRNVSLDAPDPGPIPECLRRQRATA